MASFDWRRSLLPSVILAASAALPAASAATLDEATSGDLSGVAAAPTPWTLDLGANLLAGRAGADWSIGEIDYDLVAFTIPAGRQLDSIDLISYAPEDPWAIAFLGLQSGSPWLDDFGFSLTGAWLMGWTHIDSSTSNVDLLERIQDHANDPPFEIPLPSGVYTLLIQDIETAFGYSLSFNVSAVPEPTTLPAALASLGTLVAFGRRRRVSSAGSPCS